MDRPLFISQELPEPNILIVSAEDQGRRIDQLLTSRYPNHSRTYYQAIIEQGYVLLNGKPVKKRSIPEEGDEIEVCFPLVPESDIEPEAIPLQVIFEDEHLLAINKPAGMVTHPAPGHRSGTFVNALLAHCRHGPCSHDLRPGIVHRLDKDTSGLLLAAKTTETHQRLIEQFSSRAIDKLYLAICIGKPKNGALSLPIGRHPIHRKEMTVLPDGKEAVSEIYTAAFSDPFSLVVLKPKTGRTHQLRVHLKHLGTPILGDPIYGAKRLNQSWRVQRQLLHAYRLTFEHPITKTPLQLAAPLPEDMVHWIQQLKGSVALSDHSFATYA